jgi:hypothetical protein
MARGRSSEKLLRSLVAVAGIRPQTIPAEVGDLELDHRTERWPVDRLVSLYRSETGHGY